jgi:hypothetical protein
MKFTTHPIYPRRLLLCLSSSPFVVRVISLADVDLLYRNVRGYSVTREHVAGEKSRGGSMMKREKIVLLSVEPTPEEVRWSSKLSNDLQYGM